MSDYYDVYGCAYYCIAYFNLPECGPLRSSFSQGPMMADESINASLVPSLPHILNVARRERREPGKIYHVRDVGVEATWSAARANHDSALLMEP